MQQTVTSVKSFEEFKEIFPDSFCHNYGSQVIAGASKAKEMLYWGGRAVGKTDAAIILDNIYGVLAPYGASWRSIIIKKEFTHFGDILIKSRGLFRKYIPGAEFRGQPHNKWVFPNGAEVIFGNAQSYDRYHGEGFTAIYFDELANYPTPKFYDDMQSLLRVPQASTLRSDLHKMLSQDIRLRSTCNPYGVGIRWIVERFITELGGVLNKPVMVDGDTRALVKGVMYENRDFIKYEPKYVANIIKQPDKNKLAAWFAGVSSFNYGTMFGEYFSKKNVIKPFKVPLTWQIDRTLDWGTAKPFALDYWAVSDGVTPYVDKNGTCHKLPKGSIVKIYEYYGSTGRVNEGINLTASELAEKVIEMDEYVKDLHGHDTILAGFADLGWDSKVNITAREEMLRKGVAWSPGTRRIKMGKTGGWSKVKRYMASAGSADQPGLYIFSTCNNFLKIVPYLECCEVNPEEIKKGGEDHLADSLRYKIVSEHENSIISDYRYA